MTRSKLEGYDHIKEVARKDVSSIVYGAKLKYLKSNQSDELEEKYIQGLL